MVETINESNLSLSVKELDDPETLKRFILETIEYCYSEESLESRVTGLRFLISLTDKNLELVSDNLKFQELLKKHF